MRYNQPLVAIVFLLIFFSCQKEHEPKPVEPPIAPTNIPDRHILLKDITVPLLPSPHYNFEYNSDSMITKAGFASGFYNYDVLYKDNKISEIRNNIFVNHDTLRYYYDTADKVALINFINEANIIYRNVFLNYAKDKVFEILFRQKDGNDFPIDRILTFAYYTDGNVKRITEQRRSNIHEPWHLNIKTFEQYDKGINVDDFSLIHDGMHDHLFLLQGFRLQKNNPGKETFTSDGTDLYTVDYSYLYKPDNTPSVKTGNMLYTGGPNAGQRFTTRSVYTYY